MDRLSWAELGNELSGIGRNDGLDRGGLAELSMRKSWNTDPLREGKEIFITCLIKITRLMKLLERFENF